MAKQVDLFVIGAGSGGVRAGRIAASHGASVMVAEADRVGGTCVIRGCVPKKFSVYASSFSEIFGAARDYGWSFGEPSFDWPTFKQKRDAEIDRLESIYVRNLKAAGAELVRERASLAGPQQVRLEGSGEVVEARHVLLATGGRPSRPDLPGIELSSTSDDFFLMETLPKSAVVIGGGYIAVEFAGILNGLGCATNLIYRGEQILRGFDAELRDHLSAAMGARGVDITLGLSPESIEKTQDGLKLNLSGGESREVDAVFFATGREPQTDNLGLSALGLELGRVGTVPVDENSTTKLPWLHAVGDITGRAALTPVAIREGHMLADQLFTGKPQRPLNYQLIPTAVFSQPELGTVGLSEEKALEAGHKVKIYRQHFRDLRDAFSEHPEKIFMKMIVDEADEKVLGVHIMSPHAAEIIQLAGTALMMGATKADFDRTVAVHPSIAEELVTMR